MARAVAPAPVGFPAAGVATAHRRLLDAIVAGTAPTPPCVRRLALPPPTGWEFGRVQSLTNMRDDLTWAGAVFGGYLSCVIDLYGGLAMFTVLPDDARFLTADVDITFRAPVRPGRVRVEAVVAQLSRREAVVDVALRQQRRLTTRAKATQIIMLGQADESRADESRSNSGRGKPGRGNGDRPT